MPVIPGVLKIEDGDDAYNTAAEVFALANAATAGGAYVTIWKRTIPPQEAARWGSGGVANPYAMRVANFVLLDTNTAFLDGDIQLMVEDATGYGLAPISDYSTNALRVAGPVDTNKDNAQDYIQFDRQIGTPMPEQGEAATRDDKLVVRFRKGAGQTATADKAYFELPYTRFIGSDLEMVLEGRR